jgi:hypothetical protein
VLAENSPSIGGLPQFLFLLTAREVNPQVNP